MKQYLIHAFDANDNQALNRRLEVREKHLENAQYLKRNGNFILGGAMLNDQGDMIGSTMVLQFNSDEDFENWKRQEIYILHKVWDDIKIYPFKVAAV